MNDQWKYITENIITDDIPLDNFKSNRVNFKLGLWDPETNGIRYLKNILYNHALELDAYHIELLSRTKNRHVGNPITVRCTGQEVCMDYLQAAHETEFIRHAVDLNGKSVIEIGAGYGRTCHMLLSNFDITHYTIVDLENCLSLSYKYLKEVLTPDQFSRIRFVNTDAQWGIHDICINIDSFAEMDSDVVKDYINNIAIYCKYLYTKNPVGKYKMEGADPDRLKEALSAGILRDIVDIYDTEDVYKHSKKFNSAYNPGGWDLISTDWALPWTFYWQTIYGRPR
jgi:putative sugar O-methyltransferase